MIMLILIYYLIINIFNLIIKDTIGSFIASGGHSNVFEATAASGHIVAIKVTSPQGPYGAGLCEIAEREVKLLKSIKPQRDR
jgi:hypothetical protein